jgi:hypothetical protein
MPLRLKIVAKLIKWMISPLDQVMASDVSPVMLCLVSGAAGFLFESSGSFAYAKSYWTYLFPYFLFVACG